LSDRLLWGITVLNVVLLALEIYRSRSAR